MSKINYLLKIIKVTRYNIYIYIFFFTARRFFNEILFSKKHELLFLFCKYEFNQDMKKKFKYYNYIIIFV